MHLEHPLLSNGIPPPFPPMWERVSLASNNFSHRKNRSLNVDPLCSWDSRPQNQHHVTLIFHNHWPPLFNFSNGRHQASLSYWLFSTLTNHHIPFSLPFSIFVELPWVKVLFVSFFQPHCLEIRNLFTYFFISLYETELHKIFHFYQFLQWIRLFKKMYHIFN